MKNLMFILLTAMIVLIGCTGNKSGELANVYAIIPAPVSLNELPGQFTFTEKSRIILSGMSDENRLSADLLAMLVKNPTGWNISVTEGRKAAKGSVYMTLDTAVKNN